jgi:hypothetical protein
MTVRRARITTARVTVAAGAAMSTVAMTYEDLAEKLGITVASARRLVLRRHWTKTRGNDGRAVIQVPDEFLQRRDDERDDSPDDATPDDADDDATSVTPPTPVSDAAIAAMSAAVADVMTRLATAQDQIVDLARKVGASEGELTALRGQVGDLRQERDKWAGLAEAHQKQLADMMAEKASRGWWPWRRRA